MNARAGLALALRLARRDLRGGFGRFRLFLACLALGVGAIAAIGSVAAAIQAGLEAQGGAVLGGDGEVRLSNRPADAAMKRWLATQGVVSEIVELRTMAAPVQGSATGVLVELKAVDGHYPLYGDVGLRPAGPLGPALAYRPGVDGAGEWGAVAERGLLDRLGLKVGDALRVGALAYRIRAVLDSEPDRLAGGFNFGPRLLVATDSLDATGLLRAGSLVQYAYRVRLNPGAAPQDWARSADKAFPDAGWRVRERTHSAPRLGRMIDRMRTFLTLSALIALSVGGIGVGNAVGTYLAGKRDTIGILKAVGASRRLVLGLFTLEIAVLATLGIAIGVIAGALAPLALADVARRALGVPLDPGPHWRALILAAGSGALVALGFATGPLSRAVSAAPLALFRARVAPMDRRPAAWAVIVTGFAALGLCGCVLLVAGRPGLAAGFVAGLAALVVVLAAAAFGLTRAGRMLARWRAGLRGPLRVALAALARPGTPAVGVVLSLGVGLTLLAALSLVAGSLSREIGRLMPSGAPAYFFIDIQPDQAAAFDRAALAVPGVTGVERVPHLRARLVRIAGRPVAEARVPEGARWAVRGDRGLTYAARPPAAADLVAGRWWAPDYAGPALISFDAALARDFGVGIGDTLTYNVLGREITGTIVNLRRIDWSDLHLNFTAIFSPGVLSGAPHTDVAAVQCAPEAEDGLLRAVTAAFPNVTAIRVRDVLQRVESLLDQIGLALGGAMAISLAAGLLVLAGAIAAGRRARLYDAAVLHALGATRGQILAGLAVEYALLGAVAGVVAAGAGWVAAWAVVERMMGLPAAFLPGRMLAVVGLGVLATVGFGLFGTWRALARPAARLLRAE